MEENKQSCMDFGQALAALKLGRHVSRLGWNGKGMHIYLATFDGDIAYEPCIVLYTGNGYDQPGWLASQADLLAEDWVVV